MKLKTMNRRAKMAIMVAMVLMVATVSATILVAYLDESQEMTIVQGLTVTVDTFPELTAGDTYDVDFTFDNANGATNTWSEVNIEPPIGCDNDGITGSWYIDETLIGPGNIGVTFVADPGVSVLTYRVTTDPMLVGGQYNFTYSTTPS